MCYCSVCQHVGDYGGLHSHCYYQHDVCMCISNLHSPWVSLTTLYWFIVTEHFRDPIALTTVAMKQDVEFPVEF